MNERELQFWNDFYTDLETGLTYGTKVYKRPADWQERAKQSYEKVYKPVRHQKEGHTKPFNHDILG